MFAWICDMHKARGSYKHSVPATKPTTWLYTKSRQMPHRASKTSSFKFLSNDIANSNTCKGKDIANLQRQAHEVVLISMEKYIEPVTISCNYAPCKEENRARKK
jgi:hypothetical protein